MAVVGKSDVLREICLTVVDMQGAVGVHRIFDLALRHTDGIGEVDDICCIGTLGADEITALFSVKHLVSGVFDYLLRAALDRDGGAYAALFIFFFAFLLQNDAVAVFLFLSLIDFYGIVAVWEHSRGQPRLVGFDGHINVLCVALRGLQTVIGTTENVVLLILCPERAGVNGEIGLFTGFHGISSGVADEISVIDRDLCSVCRTNGGTGPVSFYLIKIVLHAESGPENPMGDPYVDIIKSASLNGSAVTFKRAAGLHGDTGAGDLLPAVSGVAFGVNAAPVGVFVGIACGGHPLLLGTPGNDASAQQNKLSAVFYLDRVSDERGVDLIKPGVLEHSVVSETCAV